MPDWSQWLREQELSPCLVAIPTVLEKVTQRLFRMSGDQKRPSVGGHFGIQENLLARNFGQSNVTELGLNSFNFRSERFPLREQPGIGEDQAILFPPTRVRVAQGTLGELRLIGAHSRIELPNAVMHEAIELVQRTLAHFEKLRGRIGPLDGDPGLASRSEVTSILGSHDPGTIPIEKGVARGNPRVAGCGPGTRLRRSHEDPKTLSAKLSEDREELIGRNH